MPEDVPMPSASIDRFVESHWSVPGAHLLRRALLDRSVRAAVFPFVLTRFLIVIIFILAINLTMLEPVTDVRHSSISVYKSSITQTLRLIALGGDSSWYIGIAREGYYQRPIDNLNQHNAAFFPLYPLLLRGAARITGGVELTGMLMSSIIFLLALILLHKTVGAFGLDEATAERAVFYVAAFPTSYFFSVPMTESLFLLLTVGSFYAAKRERWWLAGILGALASATRVPGITLFPALLLLYWQRHRGWPRMNIVGVFLIPAGLLAFICYLYLTTGNAFAFKDAQVAFGRNFGFFMHPLFYYVTNPHEVAVPWSFNLLNFAAAVLSFACGFVLVMRREWALAFYTLASIIIPLSAISLLSLTRYTMVIFPVFMILAEAGRSPRIDQTIRTIFVIMLGLMAALFAAKITIAMA